MVDDGCECTVSYNGVQGLARSLANSSFHYLAYLYSQKYGTLAKKFLWGKKSDHPKLDNFVILSAIHLRISI